MPTLHNNKMVFGFNHSWISAYILHNSTLKDMMSKMAKQEGVTEQLKATDQMAWVQKMNSIKHRAEEFIFSEYVYAVESAE